MSLPNQSEGGSFLVYSLQDFMYPYTTLTFVPPLLPTTEKLFEAILKTCPPQCLAVTQSSASEGYARMSKVGIFCDVKIDEDRFVLWGKERAELLNLKKNKDGLWEAEIKVLDDNPKLNEVSDVELPMILGCIEAIYVLLMRIEPKIKNGDRSRKKHDKKNQNSNQDAKKRVRELIVSLKSSRRDIEMAYKLPWFVLLDFSHVGLHFKEKMLATNGVMDRLQLTIEMLQLKEKILTFGESLSEDPTLLEDGLAGK